MVLGYWRTTKELSSYAPLAKEEAKSMNQKTPKPKKVKKAKNYKSGETFVLKLPFELHDFSELLSFDQVMDTLFIINQYTHNTEYSMFEERHIEAIREWFTRNDINKFKEAKKRALVAQTLLEQEKNTAKEIIQMPFRKESWH